MNCSQILEQLANRDNKAAGDYEQDGILYCGKCHTPKQCWVDWIPDADGNRERRLVPCICQCEQEAEERQKERDRAIQFRHKLADIRELIGGRHQDFITSTFDKDDDPESSVSKTCRTWVAEWKAMKEQNVGLLFYGAKGTGKSFYAACIANALAEKQILTAFTSTANLMNILSTWDKTETMDAICRVPLLVLDDLGAERDTTYSAELMYNVFDSRCKSRKPTIVTTNFDLKDMAEEKDLWRSRIYDRVTEMCPFLIRMEGKSRRKANADKRRQDAIEILRNAAKKKG